MACEPIKAKCTGQKTYSVCSQYEGTVNAQSSLIGEPCFNIEETTQDIYNQLEQIDLSELGDACLTYILDENKVIVKNVLLKYEEEICSLREEIETLKNTAFLDMSIADSNLDFECLTDACEGSINTVKELLQALITKSCTP
jgi:hypothetical protein